MILRKSIRVSLSAFLLLCFSVAIIPVDFLHNHASANTCTELAKHNTCHHKLHISKKASYCFACNLHFDRSFSLIQAVSNLETTAVIQMVFERAIQAYAIKMPLSFLRGPPQASL